MVGSLGPRTRARLYRSGLVLLALSLVVLVAPAARALPGARLVAQAVMVLVDSSPSPAQVPTPRDTFFNKPIIFGDDKEPEPTMKPSAAPTPIARRRHADLTFGLSGSATTGAAVTSATHQSANGQASNTLGFQASVERRSDKSDFRLSLPASINSRGSYLGSATAEFVTSRGVFTYGFLPLGPLGALPLSSIDRAYSFTRPLGRNGELGVFSGSGLFVGPRTFAISGVRMRRGTRAGVATIEAFHARSTDDGGRADAIIGGFASRPARLSTMSEFAIERTQALGDVSDGTAFAYQLRADYQLPGADLSLTRRFVTDRFVGLGGAGGRPESLTQGSLRTAIGRTQIDAQTSFDSLFSSAQQSASVDRRHELSISRPIGAVQAGFTFADDRSVNQSATSWTGNGSQNLAFLVHGTTIIESLQATRSTATGTSPSSSVTTSLDLLRPTRIATLQAQLSRTNQTGAASTGHIDTATVGAARSDPRLLYGISDTLTRTTEPAVSTLTNATTLSIGKKVFRDVLLQVQFGRQTTRSATNPASNGSTSLISFSLGAPFALGSASTLGKVDPRAPATILGSVVDEGSNVPFASALGSGIANLAVTLDGIETQHTDARGRFQFRFVSPGRHEVRIEPADLPRGYTVNYPYVTISVVGGQTAQIGLAISSASGAIAGRISQKGSSGVERGVENAAVRIDGADIALSGPLGDFGFGRLKPGPHTIEVLDASLPADVQLTDRKRIVTAMTGSTTRVDFLSAPLGSISGKLVASNAGKDVPDGPIANAYVVANPGERAAITTEDGTFTIDNLPAGAYTVAVDAETLPQDTDATEGVRTLELHPGERVEGFLFTIREKLRAIDFTFSAGSKESPISLALASSALPPGGVTTITVRTPADVLGVNVRAFGSVFALKQTKTNIYSGRLIVPLETKPGETTVVATAVGAHAATATTKLDVDKSLPLIRLEIEPKRPSIGQYVRVRARFVADVSPGDIIAWQDGSMTKIPAFTGARTAIFSVRVGALPFHGIIRTKTLPIPIAIGM